MTIGFDRVIIFTWEDLQRIKEQVETRGKSTLTEDELKAYNDYMFLAEGKDHLVRHGRYVKCRKPRHSKGENVKIKELLIGEEALEGLISK